MDRQPLVSILINNYNYACFLAAAIDSALSQTYTPIEVIVVDDGSTDDSAAVIARYGDRIKAIPKANGGQASAFNAGFLASQGEVICFLDADDLFVPNKIQAIVEAFEAYPTSNWIFHTLEFFGRCPPATTDENLLQYSGLYDLRPYLRRGKLDGCLPFNLSTATSGMCFRRSLLEQILPMSESIRITSDDYLKYVALGISPGLIDFRNLARQRIHGDNAYTLKPQAGQLRAKTQILTAYNIKKNFLELSRFADNLMSLGICLSWWENGIDLASKPFIQDYPANFWHILKIYTKALYYHHLHYRIKA